MKNVMITGAAGFLGRGLSKYLASRGIRVVALAAPEKINGIFKHELVIPFADTLDNTKKLSELMEAEHIDVTYHFAWHWHGDRSKDFRTQCENIEGCINVLEACSASSCRHVVVAGSASEYAYSGSVIDGSGAFAPGDAYSCAKAAAHMISVQYAIQHDININWLLIGSIYGPGRDDENLITHTIKSLLANKSISCTRLEQMWDYIYIDDAVRACYLVGEKGRKNREYPVGSGNSAPLSEYMEIINRRIENTARIGIGDIPYKNGVKPDNSVLDISSLTEDTGFLPEVSFDMGIGKTIEYFEREYGNKEWSNSE